MPESLPRSDAEFLQWSRHIQVKIAADPQRYGFSAQRAAALTSAWEAFDAAYQKMHTPDTRTSPNAQAKRMARATLERVIRPMAQTARALLAGSDALRELGLRRPSPSRTRLARPADPPSLRLIDIDGSTVRVALADPTAPTRRGKPRGAAGALIFFRVGDDDGPWQVRMTRRPRFTFSLGDALPPGTRVRIGACWINPRNEKGPMSSPLELRTGYPRLMRAA